MSVVCAVTFTVLLLTEIILTIAKGDGIILGGSSFLQLEENINALETAKKLPDAVLAVFDESWYKTKALSEPYYAKF